MTSYYPDLKRYSRISALQIPDYKILPLLLLPLLFFVSSCSENATSIGTNLLPGGDLTNLKATDTILARTFNLYTDSVLSSKEAYSYLGGQYDPYFGNTFCDFVSQLRLTKKWPGGEPTVDSIKLYFSISGAKGDHTYKLALKMYEITEFLSSDSSYYSKRNPRAGMLIGSFPIGAVAKDTATNFEVTLPNTFGEYLLRDTTKLVQGSTTNDFRSYFRGLYLTVEQGDISRKKGTFPAIPALMIFNPASNRFIIRVYYHIPTSESGLYYDFIINDKSVRYNRFFHDLSTADPAKRINHVNDSIPDSITCVQSFYGVHGKIRLKGLEAYKAMMPLSVNKARLVFTALIDGVEFTSKTIAPTIYLAYTNADGTKSLVQDFYINASFFGGGFSASASTYSFNLAAFVQAYLEGKVLKPEIELYLPEGETRNAVLKSAGSVSPPKFTLVYTRF